MTKDIKRDVESLMLAQDQLLKPANYGVLKSMLHIFLPASGSKSRLIILDETKALKMLLHF